MSGQIARRYGSKVVYIPENAIDPRRFARPTERSVTRPLRVVFVGRLVPYKAADILIEAAAPLIRAGSLELEVIGDGPEKSRLQIMAADAGLPVRFPGWIAHQRLQDHLRTFDVFAFPSLREFGGAVVLEAMAVGVVPIVVDYGGPGELVSPLTGFAIPMGRRAAIVRTLGQLLDSLIERPDALAAMRRHARARVLRSFTWSAKAAQVHEVYRWVLGHGNKPDFVMPIPDVLRDMPHHLVETQASFDKGRLSIAQSS
jgi:glycosyltransferase involved in cell wall biosynthesis